jgi:hypothetical protein
MGSAAQRHGVYGRENPLARLRLQARSSMEEEGKQGAMARVWVQCPNPPLPLYIGSRDPFGLSAWALPPSDPHSRTF